MRNELKRCNYLGNIASLKYLSTVAVVGHKTDLETVSSICTLNGSLNLNCKAAIFFFEELGVLTIGENSELTATDFGKEIAQSSDSDFSQKLASATFRYLFAEGLINLEGIFYDPTSNLCHIRRSGFPLLAAVFRNFLLDVGALSEVQPGIYQVANEYESLFENYVKKERPKLTLEDLLEKQKRQEAQGRLAEEFVVEFEKARLLWCPLSERVKQISDFDVTAGYDILSFNDGDSAQYDRYIEVKSYFGTPHFFWSANEYETAQKSGEKYYLYLVDMEKYLTPGYQPLIIPNPSSIFGCPNDWMIEPASWKITKI